MRSIRRWLLGWSFFGLSAMSIAAGLGIFHTAHEEAGELFDYELRTVAMSLPASIASTGQIYSSELADPKDKGIADDLIIIAIWDTHGNLIYHSHDEPVVPQPHDAGFSSVRVEDKRFRVYSVLQPDRFIAVAQPFSVRENLALRLAWRTLWPLMVCAPLMIGIILLSVGRGLRPLRLLSNVLAKRSIRSLDPLPLTPLPVEIRPLVSALNDLLRRVEDAANAQRIFVADAAHELRTPLAALKLELQALKQRTEDAANGGRHEVDMPALDRLEDRTSRIIHLTQQLLVLAREDANATVSFAPLSLRRLAEQSVGDLSLFAELKQIDLGLECVIGDAFDVFGDANGLRILLNNLIDNAIRHTPEGGKIDVALTRHDGVIDMTVTDTGTGVPEREIHRVLDRFYRSEDTVGQGSGLGLAIAKSIAARHAVRLLLENQEAVADGSIGRGLRVSVSGFPELRQS